MTFYVSLRDGAMAKSTVSSPKRKDTEVTIQFSVEKAAGCVLGVFKLMWFLLHWVVFVHWAFVCILQQVRSVVGFIPVVLVVIVVVLVTRNHPNAEGTGKDDKFEF